MSRRINYLYIDPAGKTQGQIWKIAVAYAKESKCAGAESQVKQAGNDLRASCLQACDELSVFGALEPLLKHFVNASHISIDQRLGVEPKAGESLAPQ